MKYGCVILADVHHPMLAATEGLLEGIFDTVVMVSSFESLQEAAQRIRPDLIVADLSLPSADGQKLLLKLDERLKGFKIIVLGSYNEADIVKIRLIWPDHCLIIFGGIPVCLMFRYLEYDQDNDELLQYIGFGGAKLGPPSHLVLIVNCIFLK